MIGLMLGLALALAVTALILYRISRSGTLRAKRRGRSVAQWIEILGGGNLAEQHRALQALTELGPAAKPALPDLWKAAESRAGDIRVRALRAIMSIATEPEELRTARRKLDGLVEDRGSAPRAEGW